MTVVAVPAPASVFEGRLPVGPAETEAARRFEVQYRQHGPSVYRFLLKAARGDRWLADDLFQEAMLRAWRFRSALPATSVEARKWMFVVARNVMIDAARHRRRRPEILGADFDDVAMEANDDVGDALAAGILRDAFARLSSKQQQALSIVSIGGESIEGAAKKLGVPPGTIKSRMHYGLQRLRQAIAGGNTN
jgi:RNA polymerase sigma-70 factor (ECF subfamily)